MKKFQLYLNQLATFKELVFLWYNYVVDSAGAVNTNGYPVTIGSGGETRPRLACREG